MVTRQINRPIAVSISRTDPDGGNFGINAFGKAINIARPEIRLGRQEFRGPIGIDLEWDGTVQLGDFTFDLTDASHVIEEWGPVDVTMEVTETLSSPGAASKVSRKYEVVGFMQVSGQGSFAPGTEFARTVTIAPYRYSVGGGSLFQHVAKADAGTAWTAGCPAAYVDTRTGEYLTCAVDGSVIDHFASLRTAHGVGS